MKLQFSGFTQIQSALLLLAEILHLTNSALPSLLIYPGIDLKWYSNNVIQYVSNNVHPRTSRRSNAYQSFIQLPTGSQTWAEAIY